MIHDSLCRNNGRWANPCQCELIDLVRSDERDAIRSQAEGVYKLTGDELIKLIMDYIDKRGKE